MHIHGSFPTTASVHRQGLQEFIRISGMTHVKTSPFYPQSNGKLERFHGTIKEECIRPGVPLSLDDARRMVQEYITHYNETRLHSAIGYVAPLDKLEGRDIEIFKERARKLEAARESRKIKRQRSYSEVIPSGEAFVC
jgi:transposase InsO family protein